VVGGKFHAVRTGRLSTYELMDKEVRLHSTSCIQRDPGLLSRKCFRFIAIMGVHASRGFSFGKLIANMGPRVTASESVIEYHWDGHQGTTLDQDSQVRASLKRSLSHAMAG